MTIVAVLLLIMTVAPVLFLLVGACRSRDDQFAFVMCGSAALCLLPNLALLIVFLCGENAPALAIIVLIINFLVALWFGRPKEFSDAPPFHASELFAPLVALYAVSVMLFSFMLLL